MGTSPSIPTFSRTARRCGLLMFLVLASVTTANAFAAVAPGHYDNGLGLTPPMGWNSWTFLRKNISEDIIKAQALALSNTLKPHGFVYVNIDDGWQLDPTQAGNCDAFGRFAADTTKFPNGMKAMGDYIHGLGLKFGLYTTAGVPVAAYDLNSPIEGTPYHVQDIVKLPLQNSLPWAWQYEIDYTKPGAKEYDDSWAKLFASWGVDYVKLDFINVGTPGTVTAGGTIDHAQDWSHALLNCGRPIFMQISNNLQLQSPFGVQWEAMSNAWRGNPDIEAWHGGPFGYPVTDWSHVWDKTRSAIYIYNYLAGPGGWNDLDSLIIGYGNAANTGLTQDEKQIHFAYWAMMCSPLLLGSDMTNMDPGDLAMLQNDDIIAIDQTPVPATLQHANSLWRLWYKPMDDGGYAVLMANTGSTTETKSIDLNWTDLGLNGPQSVRDIFTGADLGTIANGISYTLANHTCKLLKIGGAKKQGILIQPANLESGTVGIAYTQSFSATGGTPAYIWSVSSGALPGGLTLSTGGVLAGTPSNSGTFSFTVTANDSAAASASSTYSVTIEPAVLPLSITTPSPLPDGVVGTVFSQTLAATGGTPAYIWSVSNGTLPGGLTLSTAGVLAGTPSNSGTFSFTFMATDSAAATASSTYSVTIEPAALPLSITTPSPLPDGVVGTVFSQTLAATGGTPAYIWSVSNGTLPGGLTLSTAGVLAGTPSNSGTFSFTFMATDSAAATASSTYSVTIEPAALPLSITTPSPLPDGVVGTVFSQTLAATGGTPAYTWSVSSGALPGGLTLSTGGVLAGTPSNSGTFSFTVTATDSAAATASSTYSVTIEPAAAPLSITTPSPLPDGVVGTVFSQTLAATGGTPAYIWSVSSGALPGGLTLSTAGVLAGTLSNSGTFTFEVTVTDSAAVTANGAFTLTITQVSAPPMILSPVSTGNQCITTGVLIPFTVAASDAGTLSYFWNWGDGQTKVGSPSETHSFGSPGQFVVSVTVMNASGASAISSLPIVVTASIVQILEVKSLAVKLGFRNTLNKDSLIIRATIELNDGFKPGLIEWSIGGIQGNVTLNASGASSKSSTVKVNLQYLKPAPGQPFTARPGNLTISLTGQNLGAIQIAGLPTLNITTPLSGNPAGIGACIKLNGMDLYSVNNVSGTYKSKKYVSGGFTSN